MHSPPHGCSCSFGAEVKLYYCLLTLWGGRVTEHNGLMPVQPGALLPCTSARMALCLLLPYSDFPRRCVLIWPLPQSRVSLSPWQQSKQHTRQAPRAPRTSASAPPPGCGLPPGPTQSGRAPQLSPHPAVLATPPPAQYVCAAHGFTSTSTADIKHPASPWTPSWECLLRYAPLWLGWDVH